LNEAIRQNREFNTIVIAALLHDIGKFLHRAQGEYKGTHEEASYRFIQKHKARLRSALYDIDLVSVLAGFHGSSQADTFRNTYFEGKTKADRKRIWKLISIVKRADCYSCAERNTDEQKRRDIQMSAAPLDSIFSLVNTSGKEKGRRLSFYRYAFKALDPLTSFPEDLKGLSRDDLTKLTLEFEGNLPDFSRYSRLDDVLNVWLGLLEKYAWAAPSDTRYAVADISLYDHLRSSAAIAACLYRRHVEAIDELKGMARTNEFVFIGGDFSGIQDFIFHITNRGSGGASKRLRARSFFVTLFSEVTVHKILHALNLPLLCNVFSAGGKFLLLAPNTADTPGILEATKREIEAEIHERFFSQFAFLMAWKTIRGFRKQFEVHTFFKVADEMFHSLETEKLRKAGSALLNADKHFWAGEAFKATKLYEEYSGAGDCRVCGRGPATFPDPDTGQMESCAICYSDRFTIGQNLPRARYVAFGKGAADEKGAAGKVVLFKSAGPASGPRKEGYYIELLREIGQSHDHYLIYSLNERAAQIEGTHSIPVCTKYLANYVPIAADGSVMSFEEIAALSIWEKKAGEIRGSDMLGVLKADIDNLGYTFSKGFETPALAEASLPQVDRKTVSRFLTMSRMIDLFFSGWMPAIMATDKTRIVQELLSTDGVDRTRFEAYLSQPIIDFANIYTVYSGGDDLVLVGPWETMIIFAIYLNKQFRKYTCNNAAVTLSAGLAFVKNRHPVASAIRQAEGLLEISKTAGKNRISFFSSTHTWNDLPAIVNSFLFMDGELNADEAEINTTFLHRLLQYHRMALTFIDNGKIEGLRYVSALSYDAGRNIIKRDKDGNITGGRRTYDFLQKIITESPRDRASLIYNLGIPVSWALYRNRKASTPGNYEKGL